MQQAIWVFFAKHAKEVIISTGYTVGATAVASITYGLGIDATEAVKLKYSLFNNKPNEKGPENPSPPGNRCITRQ